MMSTDVPNLEDVFSQALKLTPQEQAQLVSRIVVAMSRELASPTATQQPEHWGQALNQLLDTLDTSDWEAMTDAEIAEMLRPEPMTGAEIVASGLTGGWADLGITDGEEWVQEQRCQRREKRGD